MTRWLFCVECHNTVFDLKQSAICAQPVYFLHSMMPSVTCLREWCQRYLPCYLFPVSNSGLTFFHGGLPGSTAAYWFMQYWTLVVAENLGRHLSCTWCTSQGNDFEMILMDKMETRHPVEGHFSNEFWAICNHYGVMAD